MGIYTLLWFSPPPAPLFISFGRHYRYSVRDVDHGFSRDYRYGYPLTFVRNKRNNLVVYFFVLRVVPVLFWTKYFFKFSSLLYLDWETLTTPCFMRMVFMCLARCMWWYSSSKSKNTSQLSKDLEVTVLARLNLAANWHPDHSWSILYYF